MAKTKPTTTTTTSEHSKSRPAELTAEDPRPKNIPKPWKSVKCEVLV